MFRLAIVLVAAICLVAASPAALVDACPPVQFGFGGGYDGGFGGGFGGGYSGYGGYYGGGGGFGVPVYSFAAPQPIFIQPRFGFSHSHRGFGFNRFGGHGGFGGGFGGGHGGFGGGFGGGHGHGGFGGGRGRGH